jgi:predicted metalloendopeptidase
MKTKRNKKRGKNKNKNNNKTLKVVKLKDDIRKINTLYEKAALYKTKLKTRKAISRKKVNNILDTKIKNLMKLFTNEKLKGLKPQDDFHKVTNITWINKMKNANEEKYYTKFDNFRITQDRVFYHLIENVKQFIKENQKSKLSKCLSNMYLSWRNLPHNSISKHIKDCVEMIDSYLANKNNLWKFLANLNKNELVSHSLPIVWYLAEDKKNTKVFANYFSSPRYGLYDIDIYFEVKPEHKDKKKKYLKYIDSVFSTCLGKSHNLEAQNVFDVEYDMLTSFNCDISDIKKKSDKENYNKITKTQSKEMFNFDWNEYAKELGYKSSPPFFIINDIQYLKCIVEKLTENWNSPKWRTYWIFIHLNQMIRFHKQWRHIYYNFYEKELAGQNAIFPDDIYPIFGIATAFNKFLTEQYRKHNYNKQYVDYAQRMASNMRELFITRLKKNKWLTNKTKQYALKKIKHINLQIDTPDNIIEDPLLDYDAKDPYGNMLKIFKWRTNKFISLNNKPIVEYSIMDWKSFHLNGTQTYVVNAFYVPSFNRIFIPLAYLQPPFIDLEDRGIEYNLANLGYVIAHEFSHSLDVIGSKYDFNGNLKNWWSEEDKKKYKKLVNDVNAQYKKFMSYDKLEPDVEFYIGENIADITGIALCNDYLMLYHSVKENLESVSTTFLSLKTFYNYYAIQMRQHLTDDSIQMLLKTNPHPPDKYRINCPLSRLELFNKIFGITEKDRMYWNSKMDIW